MDAAPVFSTLLLNVKQHIGIDSKEADQFVSFLKAKTVFKKEHLLLSGDPCRTFSFVNSGILRAYFINPEGKESTIMFAIKNWWITDMYCFVNELPAMLSIQALEESEVLCLEKNKMDELLTLNPKFERYFRILLTNAYTREQLRTIQNLSLPAEERYRNFVKKYPDVVPMITQKQLASYLGITPEFLSMIRAKRED